MSETGDWAHVVATDLYIRYQELPGFNIVHEIAAALRKERAETVERCALVAKEYAAAYAVDFDMSVYIAAGNIMSRIRALTPRGE